MTPNNVTEQSHANYRICKPNMPAKQEAEITNFWTGQGALFCIFWMMRLHLDGKAVLESVDGVYRPHQVFAVAERPSLESPEDRGVQHPSALCSEHELMFWRNDLDWPRTLCSLHADLMYRHNIFWPPAPYLQHHSLWRSVEVNSKQTPAPLCSGWMLSSRSRACDSVQFRYFSQDHSRGSPQDRLLELLADVFRAPQLM